MDKLIFLPYTDSLISKDYEYRILYSRNDTGNSDLVKGIKQ